MLKNTTSIFVSLLSTVSLCRVRLTVSRSPQEQRPLERISHSVSLSTWLASFYITIDIRIQNKFKSAIQGCCFLVIHLSSWEVLLGQCCFQHCFNQCNHWNEFSRRTLSPWNARWCAASGLWQQQRNQISPAVVCREWVWWHGELSSPPRSSTKTARAVR